MKFPAGLHGASHAKNIARSIVAINSIARPSPATAEKPATTTPPAPKVPGVPATSGILGFKDAFRMVPISTGTELIAELPYSPKEYSSTLNLATSIRELPGTAAILPVVKALASPTSLATQSSLESYLYNEFVAASASISTHFDNINNRAFVLCKLSVADDIQTLLSDAGTGGG